MKANRHFLLNTFTRGVLILSIFIILLAAMMQQRPFQVRLREGDVALKSAYAPFDFTYTGPVDEERTELLRQRAKDAVKEIYIKVLKPQEEIAFNIDRFFNQLSAVRQKRGLKAEEIKSGLLEGLNIYLSDTAIKSLLRAENIEQLAEQTRLLLYTIYSNDIIDNKDLSRLLDEDKRRIIITEGDDKKRIVAAKRLQTLDEIKAELQEKTKKALTDKRSSQAILELLSSLIDRPNLYFDEKKTAAKQNEAAKNIPLQYKQVEVKKGELIIDKGQRATKYHIEQLIQLERHTAPANKMEHLLGFALLIALLLVIFTVYLFTYEADVFQDISKLVLIGILAVGMIFISQSITISPLPSYAIPMASISMLLVILLNSRIAMFMTVCLCIAVGITLENSLNMVITLLTGSIVGVYSVGNIRRRSQIIKSGFLIGGTNFLVIVAVGLLNNLGFQSYRTDATWGFANGIICAFIVMGVLPLLEHTFNLTTNITLLELSDMNHPLLKELVLKAAGTYHHSIMVGNLAEAACDVIGANSLLARVGAYYHDIGKIEKAEYFSENETNAKSLHDKLTPSMSRLIIANHVKDGVELGRKYKLPRAILDFVEQHHGRGVIFYFFQKALEQVEDESMLKEEGFRYPGPRPQTKETAIVLLADSAEAASRSLANPTPVRLDELVHTIINNKFIDGQLDECALTLKDLNMIAEAFTRVLTGLFHIRVEYPNEG